MNYEKNKRPLGRRDYTEQPEVRGTDSVLKLPESFKARDVTLTEFRDKITQIMPTSVGEIEQFLRQQNLIDASGVISSENVTTGVHAFKVLEVVGGKAGILARVIRQALIDLCTPETGE